LTTKEQIFHKAFKIHWIILSILRNERQEDTSYFTQE